MRILAVADEESRSLYEYYQPGRLKGYDLIVACGDLRPGYLDFLTTMSGAPLIYVRGNHDELLVKKPVDGCTCIEDRLFTYGGLRFLGLGGSLRYRPGGCMYTEAQMRRRIARLRTRLWLQGGFDVLVTHAPARHLNDLEDLPHHGFECFHELLERYRPRYMLHGHIHACYGTHVPKCTQHGATTVINACDHAVIELEPLSKPKKRGLHARLP